MLILTDMRRLWDMLRSDGFAPDIPWQHVDTRTRSNLERIVHQIEVGAALHKDELCRCECDVCLRCEAM